LTPAEQAALEDLAKRRRTAQGLARRARIVLAAAAGKDNKTDRLAPLPGTPVDRAMGSSARPRRRDLAPGDGRRTTAQSVSYDRFRPSGGAIIAL
jgi:hypothetical protein